MFNADPTLAGRYVTALVAGDTPAAWEAIAEMAEESAVNTIPCGEHVHVSVVALMGPTLVVGLITPGDVRHTANELEWHLADTEETARQHYEEAKLFLVDQASRYGGYAGHGPTDAEETDMFAQVAAMLGIDPGQIMAI